MPKSPRRGAQRNERSRHDVLGKLVSSKRRPRLQDRHPIALFHKAKSGGAAPKAAADDYHVKILPGHPAMIRAEPTKCREQMSYRTHAAMKWRAVAIATRRFVSASWLSRSIRPGARWGAVEVQPANKACSRRSAHERDDCLRQ